MSLSPPATSFTSSISKYHLPDHNNPITFIFFGCDCHFRLKLTPELWIQWKLWHVQLYTYMYRLGLERRTKRPKFLLLYRNRLYNKLLLTADVISYSFSQNLILQIQNIFLFKLLQALTMIIHSDNNIHDVCDLWVSFSIFYLCDLLCYNFYIFLFALSLVLS